MCVFPNIETRRELRGEQFGFEYEVTVGPMGFRCGYIRVLPGHPWFGLDYNDILVDVHGGLTYSSHGVDCTNHPGAAEWWIGFDCGHFMDALDPALRNHPAVGGGGMFKANDLLDEYNKKLPFAEGEDLGLGMFTRIRTRDYVQAECESLCEQAKAAQERLMLNP
jgi:hypothetical protein